jgi:hypothetical protein
MPDSGAVAVTEAPAAVAFRRYTGTESWTDLASGAVVAPGADLIPGDLLTGVPFIITAVTLRPSDYASARDTTYVPAMAKPHYASLEVVTGDDAEFARARKRNRITEECPVDPGEELIFNESGTGVYRQIVGAFEAFGWIILPDGPQEGPYGESRLDAPPESWEFTADGIAAGLVQRFDSGGATVVNAPVLIYVKRGLRRSEYENDFTKEAVTRYLA